MTKVTLKIFAVIEFIAKRGGAGVLPNDLVKALGLNQATCIRILKELVSLGYLEQISRQHGYVIGPMAHWLARTARYKKDLLALAEPLVAELARREKQSVLIASLHEGRRTILCHHNFNPAVHPEVDAPWYEDQYLTATGQVLLAYAESAVREAVLKRQGPPKLGPWKGLSSLAALERECERIRKAGFVAMEGALTGLFITAFPLFHEGAVEAAIGMSVPLAEARGARAAHFTAALRDCAARINRERNPASSVG
ncbi:MAG: MarR family transcriptional regulator [Spirochaetes bacterium]|nr:MarR family transcriptional regulator [Spirochaetota bacterium]